MSKQVQNQFKPPILSCQLCLKEPKLLRSHILPRAYFKEITRNSSGKAISFDDFPDTVVRFSSSQWVQELMCEACEKTIGRYEASAIETLRTFRGKFGKSGEQRLCLESNHCRLFLTSLIWRSAIATIDEFQKVCLPKAIRERARRSLFSGTPLPRQVLTCTLRILTDKSQGFDDASLRNFLITPIPRVDGIPYSFLFLIDGILLDFFCPGLTESRDLEADGVMSGRRLITVPTVDIFEVRELVNILVAGYGKNLDGKLSKAVRERAD
jgi:hypothetical protein